jgi:hypothetical protein
MTDQLLRDPQTPIGVILEAARPDGLVLESEDQMQFAVLPLDDDVIDLLIERNSKFRAVCQEIREQMKSGQFQTHEEVKRALGSGKN